MRKRDLVLENNVLNDYFHGVNNKELCLKYNRKRGSVQKILIRHGVKLRSGSEVSKKYNINEEYFENIDNGDKAYILGLIYADGTISKTTAKINLIETDKQILFDVAKRIYNDNNYQIRYLVGGERKWKDGHITHSKPQVLLLLTRKKIVEDLKRIGLSEKKSFKIRFPNIDEKYFVDFIRGYFDGDGCFYVSKKHKNNNRVTITSNKSFIFELKSIIDKRFNTLSYIVKTNKKNINNLCIYGNNKVKDFLDQLYDNSELRLKRKYEKYRKEYYINPDYLINVELDEDGISSLTIE